MQACAQSSFSFLYQNYRIAPLHTAPAILPRIRKSSGFTTLFSSCAGHVVKPCPRLHASMWHRAAFDTGNHTFIILNTIWAVSTMLVPLSMLHFWIYLNASCSVMLFLSISRCFASSIIFCSSGLHFLGCDLSFLLRLICACNIISIVDTRSLTFIGMAAHTIPLS